MYRRGFTFLNHAFVLCFFLCLPLLFCAVNVWGPSLAVDPRVLRPFAFLGGYWLAFFHYSAYAGILYLVLRVVGLLGGNGAFWQQAYTLYAKAAFVAVMAILVYGAWNALHPVVRTMEHDTGKHLSQPVKIVLVTLCGLGILAGLGALIYFSAIDPETAKAIRDSRAPEQEDSCSMCGKFCAVRSMNKALNGEYIDIL